jgi:aryl-alcohol dehydrogenase-like predicted oxidoreductase
MAQERGMGTIVKRPIANAVWGSSSGSGRQAYRERAKRMADMGPIPGAPEDRIALALGFTLAHDTVDTAIVGTRNPEHMQSNTKLVERSLPLPQATIDELHRRFEQAVHT